MVSASEAVFSKERRMLYSKTRRRPKWLELLGLSHRKEQMAARRWEGLFGLFIIGVVLTVYSRAHVESEVGTSYFNPEKGASRRLLSSDNATTESHGLEWEQCDFEKSHTSGAWLFNHLICVLIFFIALAIICDDFFVPSLEVISEKLNLSEDVAGATFMAAGSSAPELFTSVAGVAQRTDVGVGTIVGSAVFNLLIIIALTAALAGQILHLDWRPLTRDAFFYAMSIACFIGFAWDGYFQHYEAVILLCLYMLYIILMVFNPKVMDWMGTWRCCRSKSPAVSPSDQEKGEKQTDQTDVSLNHSNPKLNDGQQPNGTTKERKISLSGGHARRLSLISAHKHELALEEAAHNRLFHHKRGSIAGVLTGHEDLEPENSAAPRKSLTPHDEPIREEEDVESNDNDKEKSNDGESNKGEEEEEETIQLCPCLPCCPPIRGMPPSSEDARSKGGCLNWLKLIARWFLYIPAFPFLCIFSWTIPDCSKDHNKKWYIVSFLMSVFWIAALSFAMVTLVGRAGCILGIDAYIMGLVIVAIGTSIPDALSSILVARDGFGDMAVSNAIGSNVFDINLGLGLPFVIRIAIDRGLPINLLEAAEWSDYYDGTMPIVPHAKFGFILLILLVIAISMFIAVRFRLNKWIGITFVILYVLFLAYAFVQELYCIRELGIYC